MISYENDTKYQITYELTNMAHFDIQSFFRQNMTRFTLIWEKSPFWVIPSIFLR